MISPSAFCNLLTGECHRSADFAVIKKMKKARRGFTLIELLVVVLIIGILASTAIPQYFKVVERARLAEAQSMFATVKSAQMAYITKNGRFANNWGDLDLTFMNARGKPCTGAGPCVQKIYSYMLDTDGSIYATRNPEPTPASDYGIYTLIYDINSAVTTCTQVNCIRDLI